MLQIGIFCVMIVAARAAYSSSSTGAGGVYSGSAAGSGSGAGAGVYGPGFPYYTNSFTGFAGNPFPGSGAGFNPFISQIPPIPQPLDFSLFVNDYLQNLQQNYANKWVYTTAYSTPGATVQASAFLGPNNLYAQHLAHQAALFSNAGGVSGAANGFDTTNRFGGSGTGATFTNTGSLGSFPSSKPYAPNFAGASSSFGPQGFHQTAAIYPANPSQPNLDSRFGSDGTKESVVHSQGPPGFVGLSTSSFSSSSDINGQKQNHREASTSVNDNGKVTTYTVRN